MKWVVIKCLHHILTLLCVHTSYLKPSKIPTVRIDENVSINNIGVIYLQMVRVNQVSVYPVMSYISTKNLIRFTRIKEFYCFVENIFWYILTVYNRR